RPGHRAFREAFARFGVFAHPPLRVTPAGCGLVGSRGSDIVTMLNWSTFVLQRRVNQPFGAVGRLVSDPWLLPGGTRIALADDAADALTAVLRTSTPRVEAPDRRPAYAGLTPS